MKTEVLEKTVWGWGAGCRQVSTWIAMACIGAAFCASPSVAEKDLGAGTITPLHASETTHRTLMDLANTRAGNSPIALSFSTTQRDLMQDGAEDEDNWEWDGGLYLPRYRRHFYRPIDDIGYWGFQTARDVSASRWNQMASAFQSQSLEQGDGIGAWHYLGRVSHLLQDMSSPLHVLVQDHGLTSPSCRYETWWKTRNSTIPSDTSSPLFSNSPLPPEATSGLDPFTTGRLLYWFNSTASSSGGPIGCPNKGNDDVRGYLEVLSWITYMRCTVFGEVWFDRDSGGAEMGAATSSTLLESAEFSNLTVPSGTANALHNMFPGHIRWRYSVSDNWFEIEDRNYANYYWQRFGDYESWYPADWRADHSEGSKLEYRAAPEWRGARTVGRFWFDTREIDGSQMELWGYPNGAAASGVSLFQYYANYLFPLTVRYNAGLLGLANRRVMVKTAAGTANGFFFSRKDNFGEPSGATFSTGTGGANFYFVAKSSVDLTAPTSDSAGNAFVRWQKNGSNWPDSDRTITINSSSDPIPNDGDVYVAEYSLSSTPSISAVAVSSSQINLSWSDVTGETGYKVERRLGSSGSWSQIATRSANVTAYSDTGRAADTMYQYRVRAYNASGNSDYSSVTSATTLATPPPAGTTHTLTIASVNPSSGVGVSSYVGTGQYAQGATPTGRSFAHGSLVGVNVWYSTLPSGQVFQKWQLDGADYAFTTTTTLSLDGNHTLTAVYGATALPPRTLSSLTVEGPSSVDEESSAQYRARATYSDGSSGYVTAEWDDDSGYASISDSGLLDAEAVSSDRDIEVEATATIGGVTRSDTKSVTILNTDAVPTYTLTRNTTAGGSIGQSPSGSTFAEGTVVSLHGNPDDDYVFSHWSGDALGTEDDITIRMDGNRTVTAHFTLDTSFGRLHVNLLPPQAVNEGAQWKYDLFTNWRDSGKIQDGITPRNRYLHFKDIPGWITPDEFKVSVVGGQTTVTNATYREILGAVQVYITPDQANPAGARWRLDGGPWTESGVTRADVSTGAHTVDFLGVSGWGTPSSVSVAVDRGLTSVRSGDYGPPAGLPIITAVVPRTGPIEGGTTVTIDGANFQSDTTVTFGGIAAQSVTVVSPARITAVTPPRASYGTVALVVTSGGQTVTQGNGFSYLNALGSNIELVGQIGGYVQAVAVAGNMAYYGEGPGLVVADFSNPSAPVERGRIALPATVKDVVVVNNIAYVASDAAGLYAVDVSVSAAPSIVGFYDTDDEAIGVCVSDGLAYVAEYHGGLELLSVADPSAIVRIGFLNATGIVSRISVGAVGSRKYTFVAGQGKGIRVIDVTSPGVPTEVTNLPPQTAAGFTDVHFTGNRLFAADWSSLVKVFDITLGPNLIEVGTFSPNGAGAVVDVVGDRLYTCAGSLRVADLAALPNPTTLGVFDTDGTVYRLRVTNGLAFCAMGSRGLRAVAVSNPGAMSLRSSIQTLSGAEDVWVANNVAYVGSSTGLDTLDVSAPSRPSRLASLLGNDVSDLVVADGRATLVRYGSQTVRIASVANPSSLSLLGTYTADEAWGVALMGTTPILAAATKDAAHLPKLDVLNLSSPSSPSSAGSVLTWASNAVAPAVAVVGNWAFVGRMGWGSPGNALDVVSLANPASPQKVGSVSLPDIRLDVAASEDGNYVYVPGPLGIQVIDARVKTAPSLLQMIDPPQASGDGMHTVHVVGSRLYADEAGFVFAFDITNPASPEIVGYYDLPGPGQGLAFSNDLIFVAGSQAGVTILRLTDVDKPTLSITSPTMNSAFATTNSMLTLAGAATDNRGVSRVSWVNDRGGGGESEGTTTWTVTNIQLAAGLNRITVTAEDEVGNLGSDSIDVTASLPDTTPPAVVITGPKPDDEFVVSAAPITLSGSVADNQSATGVVWSITGCETGTADVVGQAWSITNLPLATGPNMVRVTATDAAGNSATDEAVVFLAPPDTNAPVLSIEFPSINAAFDTSIGAISLSGTAEDDTGVSQVHWANTAGGAGLGEGVSPWSVNGVLLASGLNVITISAADAAGNVASDTLAVTYTPPATVIGSLGIDAGVVSFALGGPWGATYVIETSTNLLQAQWVPLSTNTIPGEAPIVIVAPVASNHPVRFYRARPPGSGE